MGDNELFAVGVLLGVASSLLPSLPESVHCYREQRELFGYVAVPYIVVIILAIYLVALARKGK